MKTDQESLKLIAAYLSGQLSKPEKNLLKDWIKTSPENQRVFDEASKIWNTSSAKLRLSKDETDILWKELKSKLDQTEKTGRIVSFISRNKAVLKVAASVIILFAVVIYFFSRKSKPVQEQMAVVDDITLSSGDQVATFFLPDSSKVWLNRKSRLIYPKSYGRKTRPVKLEGEAYFEVRSDTSSYFIVTTDYTSVQVLGTTFNIKEDETAVILTVSDGVVKFSDPDGDKVITVTAGEKGLLDSSGELRKAKNDNPAFATWRRSNNPDYEKEKMNPKNYLSASYTWRKNKVNRSVINGALKNTAVLTDYKNIVLKITYKKHKGNTVTLREKILETVKAGETIPYQKRLLDFFTHTRSLEVEIESAEIAPSQH